MPNIFIRYVMQCDFNTSTHIQIQSAFSFTRDGYYVKIYFKTVNRITSNTFTVDLVNKQYYPIYYICIYIYAIELNCLNICYCHSCECNNYMIN